MGETTRKLVFDPADIRGLARLISWVEDRDPQALALMAQVHAARRGAFCVGVTGPPGAGKSTLVDQLIAALRAQGQRVAVVAIDPSSPFSGGAVLGDRIRMQRHAGDDGVYIRSIGSRGARGGLAYAARAIVEICDAYGFDWVIIETVGVGQSEFDIMQLADCTVVVLVPEAGDTVQTLKAGLLEIADLFVVNKADRAGADQMARALQSMVGLNAASGKPSPAGEHDDHHRQTAVPMTSPLPAWQTPVLTTTATTGEGIDAMLATVAQWRARQSNDATVLHRREQMRRQTFLDLCTAAWLASVQAQFSPDVVRLIDAVARGEANPYDSVETLLHLARARPE